MFSGWLSAAEAVEGLLIRTLCFERVLEASVDTDDPFPSIASTLSNLGLAVIP